MAATLRHDKSIPGCSPDRKSTSSTSSRGNKLAKRARSFKEDLIERLSHMRSPGGSNRMSTGSAGSATSAQHDVDGGGGVGGSGGDLQTNIRQVHVTLHHLRDVVSKNKLEMLSGNGTIVLETITAIHAVLKSNLLTDQSSTLASASNQVYQSLANLIKICDDYLLDPDKPLTKEVVFEAVQLVEDAVKNLVKLAEEKMSTTATGNSRQSVHHYKPRTLCERSSLDSQRSSLPDIPLTPREKAILEQTSSAILERHAQSTESVLMDGPPPKPPHPDRMVLDSSYKPPLPPKRRHKLHSSDLCNNLEQLSMRSKSPEDSSSLLSASAGSLDSVLNHSRDEEEEEEMKDLIDSHEDSDQPDDNILGHSFRMNGSSSCCCWDSSSSTSTEQPVTRMITRDSPVFLPDPSFTGGESCSVRSSQAESGICSLPSRRSSGQSYTTTTSQQMNTSSTSHHEFHHSERKLITSGDSGKYSLLLDTMTGVSMIASSSSTTSATTTTMVELNCCTCHDNDNTTYCPVHLSSHSPLMVLHNIPCCHDNMLNTSPRHLSPTPVSGKCSPCTMTLVEAPPALPVKTRTKRERHQSQYDNVPDSVAMETRTMHQDQQHFTSTSVHNFVCESNRGLTSLAEQQCASSFHSKSSINFSAQATNDAGIPPPLPLKKKHIMAYMEMFGNASHGSTTEFLRHSVHSYNLHQSEWQHQDVMSLSTAQSCSFNTSSSSPCRSIDRKSGRGLPPALPPKKSRTAANSSTTATPTRQSLSSPPPTPPVTSSKLTREEEFVQRLEALQHPPSATSTPVKHKQPQQVSAVTSSSTPPPPTTTSRHANISTSSNDISNKSTETGCDESPLDVLDVSQFLVFKKHDEDGPEIRGGHPLALIVHATKATRNDFLYQEAFLTTYRTFLSPLDLIHKLRYRYDRFINCPDSVKQRAARESFSLLVRVVDDLTFSDIDDTVFITLFEFVQQLLCRGDLSMAKALRTKLIEKHLAKQEYIKYCSSLNSQNISTKQSLLLDFKSEHVAEQMTLLDADLFFRIEIPEVLIWAQEQNEERSPNLTKFTEHFNNMSYWARSRILEQNDAKDREKYVTKFIKVMKHLRRINNFNSYLALLSALDSAPIRRLEWQKHITEGLKEYCALIDSSSSFRAYRQALGETHPPCIPYIGLVLQDLTFVHIGNNDLLSDGGINFSKRWQQYNIVENMKRFKKGRYQFKKNEKIISFFNNFEASLTEEAMWQISESIKPRAGRKVQ